MVLPADIRPEHVMAARRELARRSLADFACMVDIPTVPLTDEADEDRFSVMRLDTLAAHHRLLCDRLLAHVLAHLLDHWLPHLLPHLLGHVLLSDVLAHAHHVVCQHLLHVRMLAHANTAHIRWHGLHRWYW